MSFTAWQTSDKKKLYQQNVAGRLPHAILFAGRTGIGKKQFATAFAGLLMCENVDETASVCGQCHGCQLLSAGTHPDLKKLGPEGKAQEIKIDQIRKLDDFIGQTAVLGGKRIVIIEQAEKMNLNAANAVLKMLEEPGRDTFFFLLTDKRQLLLPTIQSRCQSVSLKEPSEKESADYLGLIDSLDSGFANEMLQLFPRQPFFIVELDERKLLEPLLDFEKQLLSYLKGHQHLSLLQLPDVMLDQPSFLFQMMQFQVLAAIRENLVAGSTNQQRPVSGKYYGKPLHEFLTHVKAQHLFALSDLLMAFEQKLYRSNLNKQLLFESLFFNFKKTLASNKV